MIRQVHLLTLQVDLLENIVFLSLSWMKYVSIVVYYTLTFSTQCVVIESSEY